VATLEGQRATALPRGRQLLSRRLFLSGLACALAHVPPCRAGADTVRQLTLVRPATGESARKVPFWSAGAPYQHGLAELNWLLRDVQAERVHPIDLRVYYLLAMLQAELGGQPIIVTSGYRTEATNERLRQQGIDAARNSFHLRGRAADVNIQGVSPARLAMLGSVFGLGGVGLYRDFVHLDTGPRRFWTG
jgi:uncharacterized protein YcbK (DUF882 family)